MPSRNTYRLTWVSLTLDMGYVFTATPAKRNPMSKERQLHGHRRAERSYSMFKVRRGGREEVHLIQNKEQRLCFAGAAVKRCPTSKVRETQLRW